MHDTRCPRRSAPVRLLPLLALPALLFAPVPAQAPGAGEALPELPAGNPRTLPAQELFRDWPGDALLERPYWSPWDLRTFQRATLFDRPLLMVMASPWSRRSQQLMTDTLANPVVLRVLNDAYISLLVNPDRRPDVRERYQTGTWPVVVFLLPNGHPLLSQFNDQGVAQPITTSLVGPERMAFLLREGDVYFEKWRKELYAVGAIWVDREAGEEEAAPGEVTLEASDAVARWLLGNADRDGGGIGLAPKFVVPGMAEYAVVRRARLAPAFYAHGLLTMEKLLESPLYDGRHGGVHRLAAAPGWQQIQYEKMLEVNAHLMREMVFLLRVQRDERLREELGRTARFVVEVLGRPGGGFQLAQWADPESADGGGYWRGEHDRAPTVDPLVLSGANALAGAALIRAGLLLDDEGLVRAGRGALELVLERAWQRGRGFDHVIEPGPEPERFLTTQADVAFGLLDAYETTGDPRMLAAAGDAIDFARLNLWNDEMKLFRDTLDAQVPLGLLVNPRHPVRANVRLARAMSRLAVQRGDASVREAARSVLGAMAGDLPALKVHAVEPALAVEEALLEPLRIEIRGRPGDPAADRLRRAAAGLAWPWTVVRSGAGEGAASAVLERAGHRRTAGTPEELAAAAVELTGGGIPGAES